MMNVSHIYLHICNFRNESNRARGAFKIAVRTYVKTVDFDAEENGAQNEMYKTPNIQLRYYAERMFVWTFNVYLE